MNRAVAQPWTYDRSRVLTTWNNVRSIKKKRSEIDRWLDVISTTVGVLYTAQGAIVIKAHGTEVNIRWTEILAVQISGNFASKQVQINLVEFKFGGEGGQLWWYYENSLKPGAAQAQIFYDETKLFPATIVRIVTCRAALHLTIAQHSRAQHTRAQHYVTSFWSCTSSAQIQQAQFTT